MALNVAVPLSDVGNLFADCDLMQPLSPITTLDYCGGGNYKTVSPIDSESSSGVSSLETDDLKFNFNARCSSSTPTPISPPISPPTSPIYKHNYKIVVVQNGRDILQLGNNLRDNNLWRFQYAHLPNNNLQMFLANRSQYHRLGINGHIQEYSLAKCNNCTFKYPINSQNYNNNQSNNNNNNNTVANITNNDNNNMQLARQTMNPANNTAIMNNNFNAKTNYNFNTNLNAIKQNTKPTMFENLFQYAEKNSVSQQQPPNRMLLPPPPTPTQTFQMYKHF